MSLTIYFKHIMEVLNEQYNKDYIDNDKMFKFISNCYTGIRKLEQTSTSKHEVIYNLHLYFEKILKPFLDNDPDANKIKCAKGCSHCCSLEVTILDIEAQFYVDHIKFDKQLIKKIKKQIEESAKYNDWHKMSYKLQRCIFLKNNQCQIYEHRPLSCRLMFSMDEKTSCSVKLMPYQKMHFWRPIYLQAFIHLVDLIYPNGQLPSMLYNRIKQNS